MWQREAETSDIMRFDVCILGAGIAGAAAAWWLRKMMPSLKVCMVEKKTVGAGASGRNAGMTLAGLAEHYDGMVRVYGRERARQIWQATRDHRRWLDEFLDEAQPDVSCERCGSWRVGMESAELEHLRLSAALLREDNFPVEFRVDDPLGRGFYGALGIDEDCGVHPLRLVRALIAASGATVYENAEVFEARENRAEVVVRTPQFEVRAERVIVALNAYAKLLDGAWQKLVTPHRGQILVTEPLPRRILNKLVYAHHGYVYFRQLPDNRFLLGGWRHQYAETEAGFEDAVTPEIQSGLEAFMRRYFPEAARERVEARWAGTMGFSPDGLPVADRAAESERLFYLLGFTGHGFGLALEVARRLVRLVLEGEATGIFAAGRLVALPATVANERQEM